MEQLGITASGCLPDTFQSIGQRMSIYTNNTGIPISIAVWLAHDEYDHNPDPNTISITSLLRPIKQTLLAKRVPDAQAIPDVAAQLSNRIGSAVHKAVETAWLTKP